MKIAYFIMVHQKEEVFIRMLNAIYDPNNLYLIHIDSKANEILEMVNELSENNTNIRLLPSRFITYAGWSMVQAELEAIRFLLNWDDEWTHFINLSGQDMPLVTRQQLNDFLTSNINSNYILYKKTPETEKNIQYNGYYIEDFGHLKRLGDREPFEHFFDSSIVPYIGSQWKIITRAVAEFSVTSKLSYEMQEYFKYVLVPDEHFFPTLIMNSEFKETVICNNLRFMILEDRPNGFNGPKTITMRNVIELFNSDALFARKFDDAVDKDIIQFIENSLGI
ncbi:beta-1,6-N-acetylglucosaminyltransferase [Paenibacillus riograndensis]|uniref:Peptide O-xylosyltransferase n=1 Tax=Paenibacillus riograndensis SBR5 TaxID=1073571 RepID=A0A0E4CWK1_9BACL|nr:beta-1,6-N-acetylglucosaminyltransferase [Paenibacillus riograndensis]CQR55376.1 hypothetical protein PRIO_2973 [Paenibacillus riograndensis SBR5]